MTAASLLLCNVRIPDANGELTPYCAVQIETGKIARFFTEPYPKVNVAQRLDAKGHLALPTFCDSHTHFSEYGLRLTQLDLSGLSLQAALERIRKRVETTPKGAWIVGGGWTRQAFGRFPTATMLDEISTEHYIALRSADWHAAWCNSRVLQKLHPHEFSEAELPCDEQGKFKSVAFERAAKKAMSFLTISAQERQVAIKLAQEEFFKLGITETFTMEESAALPDYHALGETLKLRVRVGIYLESLDAARNFMPHTLHHTSLEAAKLFSRRFAWL
jgi:Predicted metal-dependent hydrolase with the TIM-barrel fold